MCQSPVESSNLFCLDQAVLPFSHRYPFLYHSAGIWKGHNMQKIFLKCCRWIIVPICMPNNVHFIIDFPHRPSKQQNSKLFYHHHSDPKTGLSTSVVSESLRKVCLRWCSMQSSHLWKWPVQNQMTSVCCIQKHSINTAVSRQALMVD